jgi:hypothetical protein
MLDRSFSNDRPPLLSPSNRSAAQRGAEGNKSTRRFAREDDITISGFDLGLGLMIWSLGVGVWGVGVISRKGSGNQISSEDGGTRRSRRLRGVGASTVNSIYLGIQICRILEGDEEPCERIQAAFEAAPGSRTTVTQLLTTRQVKSANHGRHPHRATLQCITPKHRELLIEYNSRRFTCREKGQPVAPPPP